MNTMRSFKLYTCLVAAALLTTPTWAAMCPASCICSTTPEGLHKAACSNISELYKFTLRQKHHNINILDLSHNNITKVTHELDRLTEIVMLDLSTNGIKTINKFLHNAKKLVHLNLANNRMDMLSLSFLPASISSLDLTNNLLVDVPSDLRHLYALEHLEMEGNPLHCSCENIMARDALLKSNVHIDHTKCFTPYSVKGQSWLQIKTKDICKIANTNTNLLDMMMGDQAVDPIEIGKETSELKASKTSFLDLGEVLDETKDKRDEDEDTHAFIKASTSSLHKSEIEGSGDYEATTMDSIILTHDSPLESTVLQKEDFLITNENITENPTNETDIEGSGEEWAPYTDDIEFDTTTEPLPALFTGPIEPFFKNIENINDTNIGTEIPERTSINIFRGGKNWLEPDITTDAPVEKSTTVQITRDTTVSEKHQIIEPENNVQPSQDIKQEVTHKTGTYVCIAIIVVLLVGLISFAIIKSQIRKRRDRRLLRQQKRDIEKASKEMIDMNKSLLGKPAPLEGTKEKKANGKYELVPTHEPYQNGKKGVNTKLMPLAGNLSDPNTDKSESPKDTNQNRNSSKDNNASLKGESIASAPRLETSFNSNESQDGSKKDFHSSLSEDIFLPINDSLVNGLNGSHAPNAYVNGDQHIDSDYLNPSQEYVPVYSSDMGRVRIKMSETPKPTTPVLITRSRSNAGDIIITPSADGIVPKTTT